MEIDFDPVDHITIGAIGPPGRRTFILQARRGGEVATLIVEKTQVISLGEGAGALLSAVGYATEKEPEAIEMAVDEGAEPLWRVEAISIGYDDLQSLFVIECHELVPEGRPEEARSARFVVTTDQLGAMSIHGLRVAAKGRPICPHCALPMDPDGHFCAASNGHKGVEI